MKEKTDSLIPIEDLNLYLGPSSSSSSTNPNGLIVSKKEPELEPLDEPLDDLRPGHFPSPLPVYNLNSISRFGLTQSPNNPFHLLLLALVLIKKL